MVRGGVGLVGEAKHADRVDDLGRRGAVDVLIERGGRGVGDGGVAPLRSVPIDQVDSADQVVLRQDASPSLIRWRLACGEYGEWTHWGSGCPGEVEAGENESELSGAGSNRSSSEVHRLHDVDAVLDEH